MKILFDQGTPAPLRRALVGHVVDTVFERGWSRLKNGELLDTAEQVGYELFITTDQNLRYQQNLTNRRIAILVLLSADWRRIQGRIAAIGAAVAGITAGDYVEVPI
jgi:hypothetical protein